LYVGGVKEDRVSQPATAEIKEGRRAVLDAAARLFSKHGYASTSLRDIAESAGMKAGSLYYHFSSKDEIVADVIELGVREVADEVAREVEHARNESPTARLRVAIRGHLRALLAQQAYASANIRIYNELPQKLRRRTHAARARYDGMWRRLIADCAAAGELRDDADPNVLRLLLIGAMNGALEWYKTGGRLEIDVLADSFAKIVFDGVSRQPLRS
jgi:AcrR family transcriptional regulator